MADEQRPCPNCGEPVPANASLCPNCGKRLKRDFSVSSIFTSCGSVLIGLFALVVGLCGTCFLAFGVLSLPDMISTPRGFSWMNLIFILIGIGGLVAAEKLFRSIR